MIWVLDFGSQYTQLIAKRLRRLGFETEVHAGTLKPADAPKNLAGVILSGSPLSVGSSWDPDPAWLKVACPILGLCFGYQWIARTLGARVLSQSLREYGPAEVVKSTTLKHPAGIRLLDSFPERARVWMSHGDSVGELPPGFESILSSGIALAGFAGTLPSGAACVGLQFHPEVYQTESGDVLLENFASKLCGLSKDWDLARYKRSLESDLREKLSGVESIHCAVSGGVDSTVLAVLLSRVVKVKALFVDHGFNRSYDEQDLRGVFGSFSNIELKTIDAKSRFWSELRGVADPETKRKIMGRLFIEVFEQELAKDKAKVLAQGTIYSDVIESAVNPLAPTEKIKSHHNVGGLPDKLNLSLLEPLKFLFKDEVRVLGRELGIPQSFLDRHPFPGPGLSIRCLGPLLPERVDLVKRADEVFVRELKARNLYQKIWQAAAILLPVQSVGVMGDGRSFESALCLRAVSSVDAMTAEASSLEITDLKAIAAIVVNEVRGINRVVYDLTSKPPGTIEWE
jgi:GMP synthase (glutamine-hydrolysing)